MVNNPVPSPPPDRLVPLDLPPVQPSGSACGAAAIDRVASLAERCGYARGVLAAIEVIKPRPSVERRALALLRKGYANG